MLVYRFMAKKRDGRALDHKSLEAIRIRAVQCVEAGDNPEDVIRTLGFSPAYALLVSGPFEMFSMLEDGIFRDLVDQSIQLKCEP